MEAGCAHLILVVGKVALGKVFVRVLWGFLVVKLRKFLAFIFIYMLLLSRRTKERSQGTFKKATYFQKWRSDALERFNLYFLVFKELNGWCG